MKAKTTILTKDDVSQCTDAQSGLIEKLIEEVDTYEIDVPPSLAMGTMTKKDASDFIDYLKNVKLQQKKVELQQPHSVNDPVFGMCFKLAYARLKGHEAREKNGDSKLSNLTLDLYHEHMTIKNMLFGEINRTGRD